MTQQEYNQWVYRAHFYRGIIIDYTIQVERFMDEYIGRYFCPDFNKKVELAELLVSERMDFSKKSETLIQIIRKQCNQENKDFNEAYPRLNADLREMAEDRNAFAHKLMYHPEMENIADAVIILLNFKNKIDLIIYTQKELDKITNRLKKYVELFSDMRDKTP